MKLFFFLLHLHSRILNPSWSVLRGVAISNISCSFSEVTLLCLILEKQGKLADSLDVIRGEKGKNLMMDDIFKRTKIAELLRSVGRVDESNALYKQLLIERPDNWAFYTCYVSTCLELVDAQYAPNQERYETH